MNNKQIDTGTAPKVTEEMVEASIVQETYFTAADGVRGNGTAGLVNIPHHLLTFCVLTLQNGYTVVGQSACASAANYKEETGQHYARIDAVKKIWPLMGYELRSQLAAIEQASPANSGLYPKSPTSQEKINLQFTTYTGKQTVHAVPMTRGDYNVFRGWGLPVSENADDEGYLMRVSGHAPSNVDSMVGYVQWLTHEMFNKIYSVGVVIKKTTFVERMVQEYTELREKLDKLIPFLGSDAYMALPEVEQEDLQFQRAHMVHYMRTLERRIERQQKSAQ